MITKHDDDDDDIDDKRDLKRKHDEDGWLKLCPQHGHLLDKTCFKCF